MAAARRATNGVKPTFDKPQRCFVLGEVRVRISRSGACQMPRQLICLYLIIGGAEWQAGCRGWRRGTTTIKAEGTFELPAELRLPEGVPRRHAPSNRITAPPIVRRVRWRDSGEACKLPGARPRPPRALFMGNGVGMHEGQWNGDSSRAADVGRSNWNGMVELREAVGWSNANDA